MSLSINLKEYDPIKLNEVKGFQKEIFINMWGIAEFEDKYKFILNRIVKDFEEAKIYVMNVHESIKDKVKIFFLTKPNLRVAER